MRKGVVPQSVWEEPATHDLVGRPGACQNPADIFTYQPCHLLPTWQNLPELPIAWQILRRATSPTLVVAHENQNFECIATARVFDSNDDAPCAMHHA
jgi:hypothetical protein